MPLPVLGNRLGCLMLAVQAMEILGLPHRMKTQAIGPIAIVMMDLGVLIETNLVAIEADSLMKVGVVCAEMILEEICNSQSVCEGFKMK